MATTETKNRKKNAPKESATASATPSGDAQLAEQLDKAQASVEKSQMHALTLHLQWRTHLLRLSYVIIIVTMHQMQSPTSACMKEIKQWNEIKKNSMEEPMSGYEAFWTVLNDSQVEILSVICASCLLWCLQLPMKGRDFETLPYRLSCAVVPLIVSLYFQKKDLLHGCLPSSEKQFIENDSEDAGGDRKHQFPIILVFHLIVSLSLFFMYHQGRQHAQNVEMVQQMRSDLILANQKAKSKKKS